MMKPTHALWCWLVLLGVSGCNALPLGRSTSLDGPGSPALLASSAAEAPQNLPKSRYGNPETYKVFGQQYRVMESLVSNIA